MSMNPLKNLGLSRPGSGLVSHSMNAKTAHTNNEPANQMISQRDDLCLSVPVPLKGIQTIMSRAKLVSMGLTTSFITFATTYRRE